MNITFIIGIILIIVSLILFYFSSVKIEKKHNQQKIILAQINRLTKQLNQLEKRRDTITKEFEDINNKVQFLEKLYQDLKKNKEKEIKKQIAQWEAQKKDFAKERVLFQEIQANQHIQQINETKQLTIKKIQKELVEYQESTNKEKDLINKELNKLKESLKAGIEARRREQAKKEKLNFYKLSISKSDLEDVQKLENLKPSFHKPVVLSKLIWTQYFQKRMNELCDRVFGLINKKTTCGIYKITNTLNDKSYIGQSVDIASRWKSHCKCGLGIDAPATNSLYNAMQETGVWNFTFELLEECPRDQLNEKEALWIETYQSNNYGYNLQKGNKV